ncbi:MAG: FAD-dependent oxidoreductase [Actinomycetota bacterium]|nr:FAD-dependent oxidoreductase [Actinomycetota bacterium]
MTHEAAAAGEGQRSDGPGTVDVAVIGGSAAGLAGALMLGRSLRSVVVVDDGDPRNAPAAHMHGYLSRDGMSPADFLAAARDEVRSYGVQLVEDRAQRIDGDVEHGFTVELAHGEPIRARRVLVATGLTDVLPDVDGVAQRWGRDVLHCPYCHGFEVRDSAVVVLATSPMAAHSAGLFRQLTDDVTVVVHRGDGPGEVDAERLSARGVTILAGPATSLEITDDRLTGVRLADGSTVAADAVVVGPRFETRASFLAPLGLVPVEHPTGLGTFVPSEMAGTTSVPGVWLAGNVTDPMLQVSHAAAAGSMAGAHINADLVTEETDAAVAAARHDGGIPVMDRAFWEQRYSASDRVWSGNPNPQLVAEATELTPGTALDVGAGEGADSIWLATQGWTVTAVDISSVALDKGRVESEARGADIAGRIAWVQADLTDGWVPPARYDLVSAQFMHLPPEHRLPLYERLAAAVAPGGHLLIVGHHPDDMSTSMHRPTVASMYFTAEQLADTLGEGWEVLVTDARSRGTVDPDGHDTVIRDAVLLARRSAEA